MPDVERRQLIEVLNLDTVEKKKLDKGVMRLRIRQ